MITKTDVYALLKQEKIAHEICEHAPVFTMEELDAQNLPHREQIVKNLFLRDDKKRTFYLVTLPGHKNVNLKELSEKIPSRKLSFANEDTLREKLSLEKGHVTPLGALNDAQKKVVVVFDASLQGQTIGIHPMENNATIFLAFEDVKRIIQNHGNPVVLCNLNE